MSFWIIPKRNLYYKKKKTEEAVSLLLLTEKKTDWIPLSTCYTARVLLRCRTRFERGVLEYIFIYLSVLKWTIATDMSTNFGIRSRTRKTFGFRQESYFL